MQSRRLPAWAAYSLALALILATLALRFALDVAFGQRPLLILFVFPIIISAHLGGLGPGLMATFLAAGAIDFFLIPPAHSFQFAATHDLVQWLMLVVSGVLVSILNEALQRSRGKLAVSQRLQAATLGSLAGGLITTDERGRITYQNPAAESLSGWPSSEALGRKLAEVLDIVDEYSRSPLHDHLKAAPGRNGGQSLPHRVLLRSRDGRETPISLSNAPIQDGSRATIGAALTFRDITENKRAEESLRKSEHYLRAIIQTTADGFVVMDTEGRITDVNDAYCAMSGYAREDILGMHISDLDAEERTGGTRDRIQRIIAKGSAVFEALHRRKDGGIFPVDVSTTFLPEQGGRFVSFFRDQSEHKLREERVALLGRMLDEAPESIAILDMEGNYLYANRRTLTQHGYEDEKQFLALNVRDLDVPESRARVEERYRKIMEDGEISFETAHYRRDGSTLPLEVFTRCIDWQGRPAVLCISNDISERKKAQDELRASEERFRAISEYSHSAIVIIDEGARILWVNEEMVRLGGYPRETILGAESFLQFLAPESVDFVVGNFMEFVAGRPYEHHYTLGVIRGDGETRLFEKHMTDYTDQSGQRLLVLSMMDITDRRRAEEERARLDSQLAQARKMDALGILAGGIAHDFNNILAAVMGYSELIRDELEPGHAAKHDLEEIIRAASKGKNLVRQILTFSRKAEADRKPISLNKAVEDTAGLLSRTIPKMIRLDLDLEPGLKPVKADPQQIEQLIINLVSNAVDAMNERGTITLSTGTTRVDNEICQVCGDAFSGEFAVLSIRDTGHGMSPETMGKIFEPFFTTKEIGKGTGLGLSSVFGIVSSHGNHLTIRSEEGAGSVFSTYFHQTAEPIYLPPEKDIPSYVSTLGTETILLVDDEAAIREIAGKILAQNGYTVLPAQSGEEALDIYRKHGSIIDGIILDLGMPGMGGKACLQEIRRLNPAALLLIASGYVQYELTGELEKLGAAGMVSKPYLKTELLQSLRKMLDG